MGSNSFNKGRFVHFSQLSFVLLEYVQPFLQFFLRDFFLLLDFLLHLVGYCEHKDDNCTTAEHTNRKACELTRMRLLDIARVDIVILNFVSKKIQLLNLQINDCKENSGTQQ